MPLTDRIKRPRFGRRGFALILTLLATLLVATMAFAAMGIVMLDSQGAQQEYRGAQAYFTARSGLLMAADQLRNVGITYAGGTFAWNGATLTIAITANPNNNANNQTNQWLANVTATINGSQRQLQGLLQTDSFAKYAFFSDTMQSATGVPVIYFTQGVTMKGPVFTNGALEVYQHPQFSGAVSSANQNDPALQGTTYDSSLLPTFPAPAPNDQGSSTFTNPTKFYHAFHGDYSNSGPVAWNNSPNFSVNTMQPVVTMPNAPTLTGAPNYSGDTTIVFNANGTMTITNGGSTNIVPPTSRLVVSGGNVKVSGLVSGNVTVQSLSGGVAGKGNILIEGDVTYTDPVLNKLGLVAEQNIIVDDPVNTTTPGRLNIHASMIALNGSFQVKNYNLPPAKGQLFVFGGIGQRLPAPLGLAGSSGTYNSGYQSTWTYDARMAYAPPPNFPSTGKVALVGILDHGALQQ